MPGRGKRGGARVIYYYLEQAYPVTLITAYAKSERADLTSAEKHDLRQMALAIKMELSGRAKPRR